MALALEKGLARMATLDARASKFPSTTINQRPPLDLIPAIARLTGPGQTSQRLLTAPDRHATSRTPSHEGASGPVGRQRRMIEQLLTRKPQRESHLRADPTKDHLRFDYVDNRTGQLGTVIFESTPPAIGRARVPGTEPLFGFGRVTPGSRGDRRIV